LKWELPYLRLSLVSWCWLRQDGTELPAGQSGLLYSIGFVVATGCLHAVGIAIGLIHRWPIGRQALRGAGSIVCAGGIYFLVRALT
jgi:urease accessory protein